LARRKTPNLPASEVDLLRKINQSDSTTLKQRYAILTRRLQDNTLTNAEHQELMTLINQIEQADLLRKINQSDSTTLKQRYAILTRRLQDNTLTNAEHQELMTLINQIEQADAERMQALITLSNLRAISIETLMQQLGIHSLPPQLSHV
jgi:hypothetical protein